jgi:Fe2+ or Zn2+ uptake regulation protein
MSSNTDILKKAGVKLTRPRILVLDILKSAGVPLGVKEIHDRIRKKADLASVYRTINLFHEIGIVREIPLGEGFQRYELVRKGKHRHYILCVRCGRLDEIHICLLDQVAKMTKFRILSHSMEFQGLCSRCLK